MQTQPQIDEPDQLVHGAEEIAKVLNLVDGDGHPDTRRAFYLLEKNYIDATKLGRQWCSTRRRLLAGLVAPRETAA
jgi:hypothetical protein